MIFPLLKLFLQRLGLNTKFLYRWDKDTFDGAQDYQQEQNKMLNPRDKRRAPNAELESIATQARRILKGEDPWEPRKDYPEREIWVDVGEPREVEADVEMPK